MTLTINTNPGAYIALSNLRTVQAQLAISEKHISTGYLVADAFDNGAVFGVAQLVRSDIAGNQAASDELGNFTGAVQTANVSATNVSNTLSEIRAVLTHLSSTNLSAAQFRQYSQQYYQLVDSVTQSVAGAGYNGVNLLSNSQDLQLLGDGLGNSVKVNAADLQMVQFKSNGTITTTTNSGTTAGVNNFLFAMQAATPNFSAGNHGGFTVAYTNAADQSAFELWASTVGGDLSGGGGIAGFLLNAGNFDGYNRTHTTAQWLMQGSGTVLTFSGGAPNPGGSSLLSGPVTITITGAGNVATTTTTTNAPPSFGDSVSSALQNIKNNLAGYAVNQGNLSNVTQTQVQTASQAVQSLLTPNGILQKIENSTSTVLNNIGTLNRQINQQLNFNASIRSALTVGLGALVDADLARESAVLTAQRVKTLLSTQSLAIANQSPNILLTLFRSFGTGLITPS
ncbi:MAG: flagellin [Alphaproteobacteria bacterium]|nr:flagellin [Alphaproteobacteria bacterium]